MEVTLKGLVLATMVAVLFVGYWAALVVSNRRAVEWPPPSRGFRVGLAVWIVLFLFLLLVW